MKIGILTFQFCYNYGAMLQAYALKVFLTRRGHDVFFVNYKPQYLSRRYKLFPFYMFENRSFSSKLGLFLHILRNFKSRLKWMRGFKEFYNDKFEEISITHLNLLECVIVGSDQVWNPSITNGYDDIYFGSLAKKYNVPHISYAASCPANFVNDTFIQLIQRFKKIGVREKHTLDLILRQGIQAYLTIDPTLLLDKADYETCAGTRRLVKEKYLFIYNLGNNVEIYSEALKIANKFSLKIVSNTSPFNYIDYVYKDAGPQVFLNLISNAEYCFVSSFHGTAFSIIFQKQFLYFPFNSEKDERVFSLLQSVGLSECIYDSLKQTLIPSVNWIHIKQSLDNLKKLSIFYLNDAINNCKDE